MTDRGAVTSQLAGASNVLFLSSTFHPERQDTCVDLLSSADPSNNHVVAVTYARSAEEWFEEYREHASELPAQITIVSVGERARSAEAAMSSSTQGGGQSGDDAGGGAVAAMPQVETVDSASDLTELGIVLSQILEEHEDEDEQLELCYDSVTTLLQFVEMRRAFRFLHVMSNRLGQSDVLAHYHLDPDAHDDQTLATLKTLFDAVVTVDDDGLNVRRR